MKRAALLRMWRTDMKFLRLLLLLPALAFGQTYYNQTDVLSTNTIALTHKTIDCSANTCLNIPAGGTNLSAYSLLGNQTGSTAAGTSVPVSGGTSTGNMALVLGTYSVVGSLPSTNVFTTAFGVGALNSLTTNVSGTPNNSAFGYNALTSLTTGSNEAAFGVLTLRDDVNGIFNTALGNGAMRCFTGTGAQGGNVAVGHGSLEGDDTLCATTPGGSPGTEAQETALGSWSLQEDVSGTFNTAVGANSMLNLATGVDNVSVGAYAGPCADTTFDTSGRACAGASNNVAVGFHALRMNQQNLLVAVGFGALSANTTGQLNTAIGYNTLATETTDSGNTAVGYSVLNAATIGSTSSNNTGVGMNVLHLTVDGQLNTAVGAQAMANATTGNSNVAIGSASLFNYTGTNGGGNVALGDHACSAVTTGNSNVCIGNQVGQTTLQTGAGNILIGVSSATDAATSSTSATLKICGTVGCPITATVIGSAKPPTIIGETVTFNNSAVETHFGPADSASPVNQLISVNSSRGGTDTDTAGGTLRIRSGLGTGAAAETTIVLQTPLATTTGTTQQAATTRVTVQDGVLLAAATGGDKGNGTINATGYYSNGTAIINSSGLVSPVTTQGIKGTTAGDSPAAGSVGEVVSINCPVTGPPTPRRQWSLGPVTLSFQVLAWRTIPAP